MRTFGNAKFLSADTDVLAESNERLGLNHLLTRWQFISNSESDNKTLSFMLAHSTNNNSFNYIIDCGDLTPQQFVSKLKELGGIVPFTKYSYSISELTGGDHKSVNNGSRTYSNFSQIYLGDDGGENADYAMTACKDRLFSSINDGTYEWGELKSTDDKPKQKVIK